MWEVRLLSQGGLTVKACALSPASLIKGKLVNKELLLKWLFRIKSNYKFNTVPFFLKKILCNTASPDNLQKWQPVWPVLL